MGFLVAGRHRKESDAFSKSPGCIAEKKKKVIFGGRMFYEGSYGIDEAVRDALILAEKYSGKKMPDRNVCQAPET